MHCNDMIKELDDTITNIGKRIVWIEDSFDSDYQKFVLF